MINPGPDTELKTGDQLLLLGDGVQLAAVISRLSWSVDHQGSEISAT